MKAKEENRDFYEVYLFYLEMVRHLHQRTRTFLAKIKASKSPLAFMEGGLYMGNLQANDTIEPLLDYVTFSYGYTALNELQRLHNGKSIIEDGQFAIEVMQYLNEYIDRIKKEDKILYAIYGTPAESLISLQVQQFKAKYGVIEGVSDKEYFTNSFHCHVGEKISPIQKQDFENRFWELSNGGKITYTKYPIDYNTEALKTIIRRGMAKGFYQGVNMDKCYCEHCGYEQLNMTKCPKCESEDITEVNRVCGYLGYSKVKGRSFINDGKLAEIRDRVSM
jgi:ribonucleoside-triphosphate reductase